MRIGLVGCTKSKLGHAAPARDLYTPSALFRGGRGYVERTCDRRFVLSAKYGLIEPEPVIDPYDQTLTKASERERRDWSQRVSLRSRRRSATSATPSSATPAPPTSITDS